MQTVYAKTDNIVDYSKLNITQKKAIGETAIADYLAGKTSKLEIPGFKPYDGPVYQADEKYPTGLHYQPNNYTLIGYAQPVSTKGASPNGVITPMSVTTGLPVCVCDSKPAQPYSNTYIQFGGSANVLQDKTKRATSVGASVDTNSLASMSPFTASVSEMLVMHLWGDQSIRYCENNIIMAKNNNNPNLIDYTVFCDSLNPQHRDQVRIPVGHQVSIYIKAYASGTKYNTVEMGIADYDTMTMYTFKYNLPYENNAYQADIALEHCYDPNLYGVGALNQQRTVTSFYAYDQNQRVMNLLQTGVIADMRCYYPTGSGTLRTHNGYSYQLDDYINVNGHGTFSEWIY